MTKKVLLSILDGFAIGEPNNSNPVFVANTPNIDNFLKNYPNSKIKTSGLSVGLPNGLMGNSEVGHMTIGAGRVIEQSLLKISNLLENNNLFSEENIKKLKKSKNIHLFFLASEGGVHSNANHIKSILKVFSDNFFQNKVILQLILDGRDVKKDDAIHFIENFIKDCEKIYNNIWIGSISGRFYAMDRDKNYDRTHLYYSRTILDRLNKKNIQVENNFTIIPQIKKVNSLLKEYYFKNIYDEHIYPEIISEYSISSEDSFIFANFRSDRMRQIVQCCVGKIDNIEGLNLENLFTMTDYFNDLDFCNINNITVLCKKEKINNTLTSILEKNNIKQLRIAETEKYAHVTFFFNCGIDQKEIKNSDSILIDSPKIKCFSEKPEMSLEKLSETLIEKINSNAYQFILVNIANCDMVGHSGNFDASVKAVEFVDYHLGKIIDSAIKNNYVSLITADHGNIEEMLDESGSINKAHTTNDVPLLLISDEYKNSKLKDGSLSNIAGTVLNILEIEKPIEMSNNLID